MRNPQTPEEWQEAVDAAKFFLLVHDCMLYGLIEDCPTINVERCEQPLMEGMQGGFFPLSEEALIEKAFQKPCKNRRS